MTFIYNVNLPTCIQNFYLFAQTINLHAIIMSIDNISRIEYHPLNKYN